MGVAILEGQDLLFYGVKTVRKRTTPQEVLREIARIIKQLIEYHAPSILAIEKVALIQENASLLIVATEEIKAAARKEELAVYEYEPKVIRKFICQTGKTTKLEVARHLTRKYYELSQYLNRTSRWEQLYYSKMFDAIAVGLICYTELAASRNSEDRSFKFSSANKAQLRERLSKLADAYIDGMLDKETYLGKKNALIVEEKVIKGRLENLDEGEKQVLKRVEAFLELVNNAYLTYKLASPEEKRELVKIVASNISVEEKTVSIKLNYPFQIVTDRQKITCGSPQRGVPRTLSAILSQLVEYFRENELYPEKDTVAA